MSETVHPLPPYVARHAGAVRGESARPTAREWARHTLFFLLTIVTATVAGVMQAIPADANLDPALPAPVGLLGYLTYVPVYYALTIGALVREAWTHPALLAEGATFAGALLSILLAHEAGHYVACRRHGVAATLPFFIPAPPLFLAGTFGAFIKIKSPIPSRRALFDIGVAGPLAGFVVLIPVAFAAVATSQPAPPQLAETIAAAGGTIIYFNDPPLLRLLGSALGTDIARIATNPFYFAAWVGLLVTSLNLLPVGQLDGGHAVFSVFGARAHKLTGRMAFAAMAALAVLGWLWHHAPGGFIYALLLLVMLRMPHPRSTDETEPLGAARLAVAAVTFLVFLLCFEPFPISISS
jgi:membrane-associated protease RseP (regulator of RpoE activity)